MGMLTALKDAVARLLGDGQRDDGELIFASLKDARSGLEPPSRQEAVKKLLGQRQSGEGGNTPQGLQGPAQGESPRVEPLFGENRGESIAASQEAGREQVSDISALFSVEGAEDDAEGEVEVAVEETASAGFGGFSLDIFKLEKLVDEEEQILPEGLVDIDAQELLEECGDIMERLAALPRHNVILPGKGEDQA